ncbi:MAG: peroxiredoxin family protein [Rubrobacteraceae bacterium]
MARVKNAKVPEVGEEAPGFNLSSAQGGSLRLDMRTVRGPVIVVFFRGAWSEEDVSYFKALAEKEDEINLALGNIVGIGVTELAEAREFLKTSGIKSYVLYDYAKVAAPAWGLLERDKERGDHARPATFLVDMDHKIAHAWMGERPSPDELLAKVGEITGLPKEPEEEEKPKKEKAAKKDDSGEASESKPERKKLSPEEREKRRAERKAAREESAKPSQEDDSTEPKQEKE